VPRASRFGADRGDWVGVRVAAAPAGLVSACSRCRPKS